MLRCPHCLELIHDGASACPHCRRTIRLRVPWWLWSIWAACGAVIVALLVVPRPESGRHETLRAAVQVTPMTIRLHNVNRTAWHQVVLLVNSRYDCRIGDLPADASRAIATSTCTDSDGQTFIPEHHAITSVRVQAVVGDGTMTQAQVFTY